MQIMLPIARPAAAPAELKWSILIGDSGRPTYHALSSMKYHHEQDQSAIDEERAALRLEMLDLVARLEEIDLAAAEVQSEVAAEDQPAET